MLHRSLVHDAIRRCHFTTWLIAQAPIEPEEHFRQRKAASHFESPFRPRRSETEVDVWRPHPTTPNADLRRYGQTEHDNHVGV